MNDRQWVVTAVLAGVVASAFLYIPVIGHKYTFIAASVLQAAYLGWQDVETPRFRLGAICFSVGIFLGLPVVSILLGGNGPGNLWGVAALMGIIPGVIAMFATRFLKQKRSE